MSARKSNDQSSLLSASTILILSGFLVGLTVGKIVADDISPYVLACGLAGFLAFIALDQSATRRQEDQQSLEKSQMEQRLTRHVGSLSSAGFTLPPREQESDEVGRVGKELLRELSEKPKSYADSVV